jgi:hypothetical protein
MIVSHNELTAAVNKAFLGMRLSCGEADVVANMVVDLQMAGLHGVHHFNNACTYLGLDLDRPADISVTGKNIIEVDLHNGSLACHLPVVMDYALESMVGLKSLKIEIKNCHNRWLAFSELVKLASKGIACYAKWSNGSSPKRTLYVINRGCVTPDVFFSELILDSDEKLQDMTIELSVQDFDIAHISKDYCTQVDANELIKAQNSAWKEGVFIDDAEWLSLKKTATAILVENSQQSMNGAGGLV